MLRNKDLALSLLLIVEGRSDIGGFGLPQLREVYLESNGSFGNEEIYHLDLLVADGYLLKKVASELLAASVQLTWKGHDLIDELRSELNR